MEGAYRLFQVFTTEIGPQHVGEDEFGVSRLPQQEIGNALLAGCPDQQVGIRDVGGEQIGAECRLVDIVG